MTLFGICGRDATEECAAFQWDQSAYSPYKDTDFTYMVKNLV